MHRGVYLLGLLVFLAINLHSGSASSGYGYGRGGGYGRRGGSRNSGYGRGGSGLEYRIKDLEEQVEALSKRGWSSRLHRAMSGPQNCQGKEHEVTSPFDDKIYIKFDKPFDYPPVVKVSLRGVSVFVVKYCKLSVEGVDTKGFWLRAEVFGISNLVTAYYSYLACPAQIY